MPAEAFRDLWQTISAGLPRTGLVKNRRKNGDFYWVQANITPLRDGEQITGFLSVRTLPAREHVLVAETTMRAEAEAGRAVHTLHHGTVLRHNLSGRLTRLLAPSTFVRLLLILTLAVMLPLLLTWLNIPWLLTGCVAFLAVAVLSFLTHSLAIAPLQELVH